MQDDAASMEALYTKRFLASVSHTDALQHTTAKSAQMVCS
jgi:hypothetical protein